MSKHLRQSIAVLLCGVLAIGISSCTKNSECCTIVDVNVQIHYQTQSGENLINSVDKFDASNIKIYYKDGESYDYVFDANLDNPNMHYINEEEGEKLILTVFPSNNYEGDKSVTLIELNENVIDTLVCEFDLGSSSEIYTKGWLNGVEINNRFIEVMK